MDHIASIIMARKYDMFPKTCVLVICIDTNGQLKKFKVLSLKKQFTTRGKSRI